MYLNVLQYKVLLILLSSILSICKFKQILLLFRKKKVLLNNMLTIC